VSIEIRIFSKYVIQIINIQWLCSLSLNSRDTDNGKYMVTSRNLRHFGNAVHVYRHFQLLIMECNRCFQICMVLQMVLTNLMITVCLYTSIKYFGVMDLVASLWAPCIGIPCAGFAISIYTPGGKVLTWNSEFRRYYRNMAESCDSLTRKEQKEIHCYIENCRNMNFTFGSFYYFKKSTIFTYFDIIANNTISMLITFS